MVFIRYSTGLMDRDSSQTQVENTQESSKRQGKKSGFSLKDYDFAVGGNFRASIK